MTLKFSKMHGLGNDFMVVDAINQLIKLTSQQIQRLADRHFGVGFDQLLILEPATDDNSDFVYRIFNANGNEVAQCGNGARCLARFIWDKGFSRESTVRLATKARVIEVSRTKNGDYTVDMGKPEFEPSQIPFTVANQQLQYPIAVAGSSLQACVLSIGNPHMVIVDDYTPSEVDQLGPLLMQHEAFPEGVNVGFMKILDAANIQLRVFERGVGETQACGSGACAAVVAGRILKFLQERVEVRLLGGKVVVAWLGEGSSVRLSGPTCTVYEATLDDSFLS